MRGLDLTVKKRKGRASGRASFSATTVLLVAGLGLLVGLILGNIYSLQSTSAPASVIDGRVLHDEVVGDPSVVESSSIFLIVLFLILVTIFFEKTKEAVEENVSSTHAEAFEFKCKNILNNCVNYACIHIYIYIYICSLLVGLASLVQSTQDMLPIVESLFAEMTILGFLSVITFICTKVGILEKISLAVFGDGDGSKEEEEENKEKLTEIFEIVHYCLFAIMIFFVVQVIILVRLGTQSEKEWLRFDRACQDPSAIKRILSGDKNLSRGNYRSLRLFYALREEFIKNRSVTHPFEEEAEEDKVARTINYGRYLSICMGETLAEVVEVDVPTWMVMALLAAFYYIFMLLVENNNRILAWSMTVLAWVASFFYVAFDKKIGAIMNDFAPIGFMRRFEGHNGDSHVGEIQSLVEDENKPRWCNISLEILTLKSRSKLKKYIYGRAPNRQQLLFWGEQYGPERNIMILRLILLFNGLYMSLLLVHFGPALYRQCSKSEFVAFVILSIIPLTIQISSKRRLVASLSHVGCIGCFRRNDVVTKVIREEKTDRAIRAFMVLHKIHLATSNSSSKVGSARTTKRVTDSPRMHYSAIPSNILQDICKTFDLFDEDGSGTISCEELKHLMGSLGNPKGEDELGVMVSLLDADGSGDISKDEFLSWYSDQLMRNQLDPHEMAESMFSMFDTDKSGSISIAEFKQALDAFDVGLSTDDVAELVKELDEDRNGMIDQHEFAHLLRNHSQNLDGSSLSSMY